MACISIALASLHFKLTEMAMLNFYYISVCHLCKCDCMNLCHLEKILTSEGNIFKFLLS